MPDRKYVDDFVRRTFNLADPRTLPRDVDIPRAPIPEDQIVEPAKLIDAIRRFRRSRGMRGQRGEGQD